MMGRSGPMILGRVGVLYRNIGAPVLVSFAFDSLGDMRTIHWVNARRIATLGWFMHILRRVLRDAGRVLASGI